MSTPIAINAAGDLVIFFAWLLQKDYLPESSSFLKKYHLDPVFREQVWFPFSTLALNQK